jgi:dolichol-phosphate mannosyltransferase
MPELSVVVPVYRCEECLTALHERLTASLTALGVEYEIVFVDDRGPDRSWEVISALAARDPHVSGYRLSRNVGQSIAITAGLAHAAGAHVVIMDCDLQDRPEDIERLWAKAHEGFDVVFTRRANRSQTGFRRLTAWAYFRLRNKILGIDIDAQHGSLVLVSRKVVDAFLRVGDRDRQYVPILYWLGFESVTVDVEHSDRYAGESSYTLGKLLETGFQGLFFQTTVLLRWIVYLGLAFAALGLALAVAVVVWSVIADPLPGWTSLAVLLLLVGGVTNISLGVASLYVGKIFDQVKQRPLYVVDEQVVGGVDADVNEASVAARSRL